MVNCGARLACHHGTDVSHKMIIVCQPVNGFTWPAISRNMQLVISDGRWLMESLSSAVLHEGASSNSVKQIRPVYPNE